MVEQTPTPTPAPTQLVSLGGPPIEASQIDDLSFDELRQALRQEVARRTLYEGQIATLEQQLELWKSNLHGVIENNTLTISILQTQLDEARNAQK